MVLYGITGGLGMGKSTVAAYLSDLGVAVVDTDDLARELTARDGKALGAIASEFGSEMIATDGGLDRGQMAKLVFADPTARKRLESILHPRIRNLWLERVDSWRQSGLEQAAVVIPLLYESGCDEAFDHVVCVACSESTQRLRSVSRGWPAGQLENRNRAQWTVARKMELAEFVLWNEGDSNTLKSQVNLVFALN